MVNNIDISAFVSTAKEICGRDNVIEKFLLAEQTTFKIGGPADVFCCPNSIVQLARLRLLANELHLPFMVIGNGSNMLISDLGLAGVVVHCGEKLAAIRKTADASIACGAGALLKDVVGHCVSWGLTGLEFAVGIPGSVGGCVFMNAGAYEGDMSQVVSEVTAVDEEGKIQVRQAKQLRWSYRHSSFQTDGLIVCDVLFDLQKDEKKNIKNRVDDYTKRRESKQPLEMPSAGSVFKRPLGYFAGTLIESCGLKGMRCGGAMVSPKHAGFIVNDGGATANDVLRLIEKIQEIVLRQTGVQLETEVRLIGRK